jgi:hypothetical protein
MSGESCWGPLIVSRNAGVLEAWRPDEASTLAAICSAFDHGTATGGIKSTCARAELAGIPGMAGTHVFDPRKRNSNRHDHQTAFLPLQRPRTHASPELALHGIDFWEQVFVPLVLRYLPSVGCDNGGRCPANPPLLEQGEPPRERHATRQYASIVDKSGATSGGATIGSTTPGAKIFHLYFYFYHFRKCLGLKHLQLADIFTSARRRRPRLIDGISEELASHLGEANALCEEL